VPSISERRHQDRGSHVGLSFLGFVSGLPARDSGRLKFARDLYDVYDSGRLAAGSDGISIAPALDTTAAVIILALRLPCEPLSGPKSPKRTAV
jgi:hypothetical protein